jgi:autotransporter-associated beta strand protein
MKTQTVRGVLGVAAVLTAFACHAGEEPVWDGGGADAKVSVKENWTGDVLPPLDDGSVALLFASAGSQALIDVDCYFYGLKFVGASSAFELSGDRTVSVGAGGVDVADAHSAVISAPLVVKDAQTWSVGTDATLVLSNAVSDLNAACSLVKTGAGSLVLTKANAISGGLSINAGTVEVFSPENPFGTTQTAAARTIVDENGGRAKLYLHDTVLGNQLYVKGGNENGLFRFCGATNVLNGSVVVRNSVWRPTIYDGGTVIFNGTIDSNQYMVPTASPANTSTKCVFNAPVKFTERYTVGAYHTLVLASSDNEINWIELVGQTPTVVFDTDYVSRDGKVHINAHQNANWSSRIYLNGHDQEFGRLALENKQGQWMCEINSSAPANISFNQTTDATCTDFFFTGQINLKKTGPNLFAVACEMTATGKLEVAEGVFAIRSSGSWVNATSVTASGTGTFVIENDKSLSKKVEVCVSEMGSLQIVDGKTVRCRGLRVNGVAQSPGTYGGASSSAKYKLSCFDDDTTGVLDVRGGGMVLMVW